MKNLLEEYGSNISNPVYKLLGKLPASFEHFKDTIYLRQPFPSFDETISLLHDKCLTRKQSKADSALVAQGKGKGKAKFSKENKSKKAFYAGCYIPHRESPFYDAFKIEKSDPFGDLYADIETYTQEGIVMLMGDLNARIAHTQMQMVDFTSHPADKEGYNALDPMWERCSNDQITNPQGSALISMMTSMQLLVMNGSRKFANSGKCTCFTANNGMSTIDYVLVQYDASHIVHDFEVGERSPKLDHTPIHVRLQVPTQRKEKTAAGSTWSYKMQIENKKEYAALLDSTLAKKHMPGNGYTGS